MAKNQEQLIFDQSKFKTNDLFFTMAQFYSDNKNKINPKTGEKSRVNIFNEGGSRSGKSFDAYSLLIMLCYVNRNNPLSIYVVRKTLKNAREISYKEDFVSLLKIYGLYKPDLARNENQSPEYTLWGSTICFKGLDSGEELGKSDIIYVNEALDINNEKTFNNLILRCEMLLICDWNPKYSSHFLFKWEGRFNTLFTHTTFVHNKYIPATIRTNILSYCPWDFKDFDFTTGKWKVPEEERSVNQLNFEQNSINLHDWMVYGEGIRCPEEGAVFKNVKWVNEFPDDCDEVHFGLDFGYTNDKTVLTKVGRRGMEVFIQYLTYDCFDDVEILYQVIMPMLLEEQSRRLLYKDVSNIIVVCDSADKYKDTQFVKSLNTIVIKQKVKGVGFVKLKKPMITVRLSLMKRFIINVIKNQNAENEFLNYQYMVIEGKPTNIPIDEWNHGIDSANYCIWFFWRYFFDKMNKNK